MTEEQEKKCHAIIHSCAVACGAGNVAPIPGLGIATDMIGYDNYDHVFSWRIWRRLN